MKTLAWGLAGLAALGGGGYAVYKGMPQTEVAPPVEDVATSAQAPDDTVPEQTIEPADPPEVAPVPTPKFDIVRIETDGSALIAGRGLPDRVIQLTLDGTVLTEVTAGADGQFVGFAGIPNASFPRLLEMRWQGDDGTIEVADDAVIIAATLPAEPPETPLRAAEAPSQPEVPQAQGPRSPVLSGVAQAPESPDGVVPAPPAAPQVPQSTAPELAQAGVAPPATPVAPQGAGASDTPQITPPNAPAIAPEPGAPSVARIERNLPEAPSEPVTPSLEEPRQLAALPEATQPQVDTTAGARPAAPETPSLFRAGSGGVTPLEPQPLPAPRQIAIDSISYSDADDVIVQGRAGSPGRVRLTLNGAPFGAELILAAAGDWRVALTGVRPGRYEMRVDLVNDTGGVIARTQTPFQRVETQTVPETSGVKVVTVQPGFTLWAIARDRYGEGLQYVQVFEANRDQIRDPDLIYPGQVFVLPEEASTE